MLCSSHIHINLHLHICSTKVVFSKFFLQKSYAFLCSQSVSNQKFHQMSILAEGLLIFKWSKCWLEHFWSSIASIYTKKNKQKSDNFLHFFIAFPFARKLYLLKKNKINKQLICTVQTITFLTLFTTERTWRFMQEPQRKPLSLMWILQSHHPPLCQRAS